MRNLRLVAVAVLVAVLAPRLAESQALTSLSSLRVRYSTRKNTVRPTGELKAAIDALDQEMTAAQRAGKTGEVRRLLAKGMVLLSNRPWTEELDFTNSVVLRTEQVLSDSTKPYPVRLEQIYSPSINLTRSLTAHPRLEKRATPAASGNADAAAPPAETVKNFAAFDGVSRDLRESPFKIELDMHDVPDGTYTLAIEIRDDTRSLGTSTLLIGLLKGLDDTVAQLETAAKTAPEALRADILFPVDRMRNVNRSRLELRTFSPERDFPEAVTIAAAVKAGRDPYKGKTGDFKRHYLLKSVDEILPYHLYVPTTYDGSRAYPLVIALHGLGGTEDSFFDGYEKKLPALAEANGYIVAAALGYRVDGGYGPGLREPSADPVQRRTSQASEDDVMQVLQLARQNYRVDDKRIYLMGHSLGAIGTWLIAPKFPDIWAAIAPFSGQGTPAALERIPKVPEFIVHGDDDRTVNVQGSRAMVAKLKELGTEFQYVEVPGGSHSGVVPPNLEGAILFFNTHKKP